MGRPVGVEGGLVAQQCRSAAAAAAVVAPSRCSVEAAAASWKWESGSDSCDSGGGNPPCSCSWDSVGGLDAQQLGVLQKVASRGVFWQHPSLPVAKVYGLQYGGDVEADGNCLFTAVQRAMQLKEAPVEIRLATVRRFVDDYEAADAEEKERLDKIIKNLYSPDMSTGWGVHVVQEVKLLAKKTDREALETEIEEMIQVGMSRESAIESVYNEHCLRVRDACSWAKYMSISGQATDEYDIVTLLYTEEGLLSVEMNAEGKAAAFGDDIAIQALASEFQRQLFVVQVHGKDGSAENSEGLIFFLPHSPRQEISHPPVFLLMRGTGWCGAGGDHYEPILAKLLPVVSKEKAAYIL
ncbi:uncharacterized protein LOC9641487 [Selaginella moellendorffii]|nr:uncharacterized protein LOC9641487 [Selaginella moellendorffii]|eukprot:XP_002960998.2 uncharacterized protein LOC9641487 [Selaginella moellendorffii]